MRLVLCAYQSQILIQPIGVPFCTTKPHQSFECRRGSLKPCTTMHLVSANTIAKLINSDKQRSEFFGIGRENLRAERV
jgi:hypothetical protein